MRVGVEHKATLGACALFAGGAWRQEETRFGSGETTAGAAGGGGWPVAVYFALGALMLVLVLVVLLLALLLHRNQKRLRLLGSSGHGVYCNADLADEIEPGTYSAWAPAPARTCVRVRV